MEYSVVAFSIYNSKGPNKSKASFYGIYEFLDKVHIAQSLGWKRVCLG